jgi:nicotinate-nucleotide adenylyltransferase
MRPTEPQAERVCIFGGTFDPIHTAHLRIAEEALDKFGLNRVLFVPAANPPHKEASGLTPYEDRFRMVQIACEPYSSFVASRLEAGVEQSYTVDTIRRFRMGLNPGDRLFFLIGADAFDELETWKGWQELLELTEFIVVTRPESERHIPEGAQRARLRAAKQGKNSQALGAARPSRDRLARFPGARIHQLAGLALPVSSSTIRARLAAGEPTPELPTEVRAFVEKRGLYGFRKENVTAGRR